MKYITNTQDDAFLGASSEDKRALIMDMIDEILKQQQILALSTINRQPKCALIYGWLYYTPPT